MYIQKKSVAEIIEKCLRYGAKIVAGGPLFTQEYESYPQVDHFVLNEAEITLPMFLNDLISGRQPQKVYTTEEFADLTQTPIPDYSLMNMDDYAFMSIQVSRGCPFSCEFCEITALLGRQVRMKTTRQVINELEVLYDLNYRGYVLIVDDNFIGDRKEVKNTLLPAMLEWMERHDFPFYFKTQATVDLADDAELLSLMVKVGFRLIFIGIETPEEESLKECNKNQNKNRDMLLSVKKMQNAGLQVTAGFIVGFDSDTPTTFQRQIDFIQQSGIMTAMVGLLNAPKKTRLYSRLESENRIVSEPSGNNTDLYLNYIPMMNPEELVRGYKKIIGGIYNTEPYYQRIKQLLLNYNPKPNRSAVIGVAACWVFVKSFFVLGVLDVGRKHYWKLLLWTLFKRPQLLEDVVTLSIYGLHYRKIFEIL